MSVAGSQRRGEYAVKGQQRKVLSREAKRLLEILEIIEKEGYFDTNVPWEWIEWEEVEFEDDSDYAKFIHEEVPEEIKAVAREIGARAYVYHKKDDVRGSEYTVLLEWRGKKYTLEVDCDPYELEEGRFTLYVIEGWKGWGEPSVYYHQV